MYGLPAGVVVVSSRGLCRGEIGGVTGSGSVTVKSLTPAMKACIEGSPVDSLVGKGVGSRYRARRADRGRREGVAKGELVVVEVVEAVEVVEEERL